MANIKETQQDTMALIDASKAMIDKVMTIMGLMTVSPSLSFTFATNPIGFLLQLLKHLGITYEELRQWLTNFLVLVVPGLEISVKAILLTNLKNMISCSIDPRIPEKYRKKHKAVTDYNTSQEYGIDINIESIDFLDKLSVNPLSDEGRELYFGTQGINDVYKFVRADDFDAFLWFVMHKGRFPNAAKIDSVSSFTESNVHGMNAQSVIGDSLLESVEVFYDEESPSRILVGNTFTYNPSGHVISMCVDSVYNENNNITRNKLIPVSDDWASVNWYDRRAYHLGKNLGILPSNERKYDKERPLCNLQFIDQASSDAPITGLVNNKLRFTILPRPYMDLGTYGLRKMLFDASGMYDPNGKYTVLDGNDISSWTTEEGERTWSADTKNLIECYKGLTVYEFNYDYVMSLKLFDAKILATTLLDSLIDMRVGINASYNDKYIRGTETVKEIIKNVINTDDSEINNCFYTFDNTKYEAMLRKTEEIRAKGGRASALTELIETLNEYDSKTELHEQIDVLHRAITQASVSVSEGVPDKSKSEVEFALVFDMVESLTLAIVTAILSPKVLMLLEVNQQLMGGTWEKFSVYDLIRSMASVIEAIVKEVRDLIIQELLKLVLKQLEPIVAMISSILLREQIENYTDTIQDIIRNCPYIWFRFGNQDLETKLDTVDYADIDTSNTNNEGQPTTNKC